MRQKIRRAHRLGFAVVTDPDVVGESLVRLYGATRVRTGAGPLYDFPASTLEGWANDPETLAIAATIGGSVEAAGYSSSAVCAPSITSTLRPSPAASSRRC